MDLSDKVVLIIDDESDSRLLLGRYLTECGCHIIMAESGEEGLRLARHHTPDLITLDLVMPNMTGWDILKELKGDSKTRDVPVVVVSIVGSENRGTILGASEILSKPVSRDELYGVVRRYLPPTGGRILVIDDDPAFRDLVRTSLEGDGTTIRGAENGRLGIKALTDFHPDLVILDLIMPEMDGIAFLDELRTHPEFDSLTVVVVTAKDLDLGELRKLEQSVSAVVRKGDDLWPQLSQIVTEILRHNKKQQRLQPPPPTKASGDRTEVRVRRVVSDLVPAFLKNRRTDVTSIMEALNKNDLSSIRIIGHNLKGIGAAYGFTRITEIGRSIEAATARGDAERIRTEAVELGRYLDNVRVVEE